MVDGGDISVANSVSF